MRIEHYLEKNAALYPDKVAIICGDDSVTYKELWRGVSLRYEQLHASAGPIIIRATRNIDFLVTYLSAHMANRPIVPLESDASEKSFEEISAEVESAVIPFGVADVLFTTGTTGKRKGTMLSHEAILADAENLVDAQGFSGDITFIISGPLNHIGSLSKVWPSIIVGATILIIDGMKDIDSFLTVIEKCPTKVATFLVPASIRILLSFGRDRLSNLASKIDFIETGAAPISQADMEILCDVLPNSRLYNTYASTETGIITTHDFNAGYCVAGCLGKPMKNSMISINSDGLIICQGKTIMSGYINDAASTSSVLRDGIIYTQDRGKLDEEGRLHLRGREGDVINIGGYKVNPVEVEDLVKSYPGIDDCIVVEDKHPVLGNALKLLYVPISQGLDKKALGKFLMGHLERYKVPQLYKEVGSIMRTYNGKLDRKYYRR